MKRITLSRTVLTVPSFFCTALHSRRLSAEVDEEADEVINAIWDRVVCLLLANLEIVGLKNTMQQLLHCVLLLSNLPKTNRLFLITQMGTQAVAAVLGITLIGLFPVICIEMALIIFRSFIKVGSQDYCKDYSNQ